MIKTPIRLPLLLAAALLVAAPAAAQQPPLEYQGASAQGLALRRLGTTKRVLMIAAHPDDESTQVLSTLALKQGADVAYLSLTRGEGGQNGIGAELGEALGLLRSEELLAARRLDGAQQFFSRAYDYGFSKNADEAFRHWPRDSVLRDVVAVIRQFRPDVVVTVWSGTPRDGHGQHEAAGVLAREAFQAAGDPARFPELRRQGLTAHAPAKLYQAYRLPEGAEVEQLQAGAVDPLLGESYFQVAMASRSRHRSQDMGRELTPGPQTAPLALVQSRVGGGAGLFAGIDTTLAQQAVALPGAPVALQRLLGEYQQRVTELRARFNPLAPDALVPELADALRLLRRAEAVLPAGEAARELRAEVEAERHDAEAALGRAARLQLDAVTAAETVVPGEQLEVTLTVWNGGGNPAILHALEPAVPAGWRSDALDPLPDVVQPDQLVRRRFRIAVPADAPVTEPYFLRQPRQGDLYRWPASGEPVGLAFDAPPVAAVARLELLQAPLSLEREATFRGVDKMRGEFRRPLRVVPAVSLTMEPGLAVLPLGEGSDSLRFRVRLRAEAPGGVRGTLQLRAPAGWKVEPRQLPLRFGGAAEERAVDVVVRPPSTAAAGEFPLSAVFVSDSGARFDRGFTRVDYPHVRPRPLYREAQATVRALEVQLPRDLRVGYVAGAGDEVPQALAQLGVRLELLDAEALATRDLGAFDAIVTGIRAYEVRPDLLAHNDRLLDYVRRGGTMIVQYNKYEFTAPGVAPLAVRMSRPHDRVTDETAPVRLLRPEHPALSWPNRITGEDFGNWVQERGLYFLSEWDDAFVPLLEMADPGEDPLRGSLLVAPYGEGTYVYTGLAFFRQLPAGVPGAYRLFANLLSLGAER